MFPASTDSPQVVFQDPVSALTPWLTIGEQIGERLRALGTGVEDRRRRVGEALKLVGLDPALMHALPAELSVGQCQRAVVARAVVVPQIFCSATNRSAPWTCRWRLPP